jgi:tripartite-type tricarboxylate transporter receptor subunit TctC
MSPSSYSRRTFLHRAAVTSIGAASLARPSFSVAQSMPDMVRLLVGLPPGTLPDSIARVLEPALSGRLARTVIVESRPGAAGRIAVDVLLQSGGDGNTLMITPSGVVTLVQYTYRKLSYQPFEDLSPITTLAYSPFLFAIGPLVDERVRTMRDFAAWCRANPSQASFATVAAGSPPHFVGEVLKQQFRFECTHVPSRSSPVPDLIGGQIAAAMLAPSSVSPYAHDKRMRVLGTTGRTRFNLLPDVPTFAEQGAAGLDWWDWYGLYASARAPADIVRRHGAIVRSVLAEPGLLGQWRAAVQVDPVTCTSEELARLARADSARWGDIVKSTGFVAE